MRKRDETDPEPEGTGAEPAADESTDELDAIDRASFDSFPASDAPGWWARAIGLARADRRATPSV